MQKASVPFLAVRITEYSDNRPVLADSGMTIAQHASLPTVKETDRPPQ